MSHIFIQAAGMTQGQIDSVTFGRGGKTAPRTPAFGFRLGAWWRAILRTAN